MASYVVLANFSDQGIKNVKQTVERADAFRHMAEKIGANVKNIYYTLGSRDIIAIVEAPDDETATALALSVCSRGNVRSETLRAFSLSEMKSILDRVS
ncbi:MAG: GYD domain-containing protein [Hyphomicrobiaceae bacterium]|nr:MAG: GYD domain-containing protein [Hyphomicrobiaceae bacterium]